MSIIFTTCFHPLACEGAKREKEFKRPLLQVERNESCAFGYIGRLCHMCGPGWGRETFDSCSKCPPKAANMALTIVGSVFVVGVLVTFIIYSIKSSADERSISSMMFKTLAAYGQVIGIASLFPYKWPPEILRFFEFMDAITSVSDRILNTDCALEDRRGKGLALIYEKAILYMMAPPIFVFCAIIVFIISHFCLNCRNILGRRLRKRFLKAGEFWTRADTRRCIIVSAIVAMVILHPTLVRQAMFLLMCVNVENKFYLRIDLQLQCSTTEHNLMTIFVAVPGILLYVLGWPLLVYILLRKRKHKLHLKGLSGQGTRSTYGFLYRGYSKDRYYWEIVIMMRKTAMVLVATFGLRATVPTQGLLALFVISMAMAAHLKLRPHEDDSLDKLEFYGLTAAFITLYFGMFFFTDDVVFAPWWGFIVTFTIMMTNAVFMTIFCLYLYGAFREESNLVKRLNTSATLKCYSKFDKWKNRFCCCCLWWLRRKKERLEKKTSMKFRSARHRATSGDIWGKSDRKDAKARHQERLRRIKLNKDAGNERGLQMAALPLADEFARRQRKLASNIHTTDDNLVKRMKKNRSMRSIITGISNGDSTDDIDNAVRQHFKRAGVDKQEAGFLSGYSKKITSNATLKTTLSAKSKFLKRSSSFKMRKKESRKHKQKHIDNDNNNEYSVELTELYSNNDNSSLKEVHSMLLRISNLVSGQSKRNIKMNSGNQPSSLLDLVSVAKSIERKLVASIETKPRQQEAERHKHRKSYHFDPTEEKYYSYNEETGESQWEDPEHGTEMELQTNLGKEPATTYINPLVSTSAMSRLDEYQTDLLQEVMTVSQPIQKMNLLGKLKSKVNRRKEKHSNEISDKNYYKNYNNTHTELSLALAKAKRRSEGEVSRSVLAAVAKFKLLKRRSVFKNNRPKQRMNKKAKRFSERTFDYCMEEDGTIVWQEGPIDSVTGDECVCHPVTGQMFRVKDLDEYGGLVPSAQPVRPPSIMQMDGKMNPLYKNKNQRKEKQEQQQEEVKQEEQQFNENELSEPLREKSKRKKKTEKNDDFEYCYDEDGDVVWEGGVDESTGEECVFHPQTGRRFSIQELDTETGLLKL